MTLPESRIRFLNPDPGIVHRSLSWEVRAKEICGQSRIEIRESDSGFRGFREGSCLRKRAVCQQNLTSNCLRNIRSPITSSIYQCPRDCNSFVNSKSHVARCLDVRPPWPRLRRPASSCRRRVPQLPLTAPTSRTPVTVSARAARQPITRPSANARAPRRSRQGRMVHSAVGSRAAAARAHPPPWASSPDRCRGAPRCACPCSTVPQTPQPRLLDGAAAAAARGAWGGSWIACSGFGI